MAKGSGGTRGKMRGGGKLSKEIIRRTDVHIETALNSIKVENDVNYDMRNRINNMLNRLSKLKDNEVNEENWRKIYDNEAKQKVIELNKKGELSKDENEAIMYLTANHAARDVFYYVKETIKKNKK